MINMRPIITLSRIYFMSGIAKRECVASALRIIIIENAPSLCKIANFKMKISFALANRGETEIKQKEHTVFILFMHGGTCAHTAGSK